jgi:hypothetical protein
MKYCIKCSQLLPDVAGFCGFCGTAQPQVPQNTQQHLPPIPPYPGSPIPQQSYFAYPPHATQARRKRGGDIFIVVTIVLLALITGFLIYMLNPGSGKDDISTGSGININNGSSEESVMVSPDGTPVDAGTFGEPAKDADGSSRDYPAGTADDPYIAPEVDKVKLDEDLKAIETAFAEKNIERVMEWVYPEAQDQFRETFERNADRLDEIADLMSTRKPVFVTSAYAEYEVTDNGKTYSVIYQKSGDHWKLVAL